MRNVTVEKTKDGKLVLTIDMKAKPLPSSTGVSDIYATTEGNTTLEIINGRPLKLGLNLFLVDPTKAKAARQGRLSGIAND